MDAKILIVGLLAFSLLLFGCAKNGGGTSLQSSWPHGVLVNGSNATGAEASGGAQAGGTQTQNETQNDTGGQAAGNTSEHDLGNLFNIDTTQPESGSGYDVPAAGE